MKPIFVLFIFLFSGFSFARGVLPKAGMWRLELTYPHGKIPFLIEFEPGKRQWNAVLINGKEQIILDEIKATDKKWIIPLGTYSTTLELNFLSRTDVKGEFIAPGKPPVPVIGSFGGYRRFPRPKKDPSITLSGKWSTVLVDDQGGKTEAIALFEQTGQTLNATILTPSGDYRYMDGYVEGDEFKVAGFDGVFHFLFEGKLAGKKLSGQLISRKLTTFTAELNPKAELPSALEHTKAGEIQFKFKDTTGKEISLSDPRFQNKPVILQIFGSWCPNCIDETAFLNDWYKKTGGQKVELISLAFERLDSEASALKQLQRFVKKRDVAYPMLLAGSTDQEKPMDKIPTLTGFMAFPTTIFLNEKHQVKKIHAGFMGPGTGVYYSQFQQFFHETIKELAKE
jgi:thiol-disulfide isomerase/thioredoxin